jgi:hypothetical protein
MADQQPVTEEQFIEYLKNPILFPATFKDYISDYFATNIPKLPISQVFGFKLQSVKDALEVTANTGVASTSYTDLGGPYLTLIPNGFYIALFGGAYGSSGGTPWPSFSDPNILMSPSVDGAAASDNNAATLNFGQNGRVVLLDLTTGNGAHTVTMMYKKTAGALTPYVQHRWLYLLKAVTDDD